MRNGSGTAVGIGTDILTAGGHFTGGQSVTAHKTCSSCFAQTGNESRTIVSFGVRNGNRQRFLRNGQNIRAGGRSVVAVFSLHIHGQRALAYIGNARSSCAPSSTAICTVGHCRSSSDGRYSGVAESRTVVLSSLVFASQRKSVTVRDGQLAILRLDVVEASNIVCTAGNRITRAHHIGNRAFRYIGDGTCDGYAADNIAIGHRNTATGSTGLRFVTEFHRKTGIGMGIAIVCPVVAVGRNGQRILDLLNGDGGRGSSLATVGIFHLQSVSTVGKMINGLGTSCRISLRCRGVARKRSHIIRLTTHDVELDIAVILAVAQACIIGDGNLHGSRNRDIDCGRSSLAALICNGDDHRQRLCSSRRRNRSTLCRTLGNRQLVRIRRTIIGSLGADYLTEVRITKFTIRNNSGNFSSITCGNHRIGLIGTAVGNGVLHGTATIRNGVFTGDAPTAVIRSDVLVFGSHRLNGLSTSSGVETLDSSIGREVRSAGIASVDTRLVGRPSAGQCRYCRSLDGVSINPVVAVAFAIFISISVNHFTGATIVTAFCRHRVGGRQGNR